MDILYTAKVTSTGGRDGRAKSDDGLLDVKLAPPEELGGSGGATNPEQLFAAGYSACFLGAMKHVAKEEKIKIPGDARVQAKVGIGKQDPGFAITATLDIYVPGMDDDTADKLIEQADKVCPYSTAVRGNVDVTLNIHTSS